MAHAPPAAGALAGGGQRRPRGAPRRPLLAAAALAALAVVALVLRQSSGAGPAWLRSQGQTGGGAPPPALSAAALTSGAAPAAAPAAAGSGDLLPGAPIDAPPGRGDAAGGLAPGGAGAAGAAPPPGCGPLTAAKAAAAARDGTVLLAVADRLTAPALLHHWLGNVRAAGITYFLVAAADDATDAALAALGLPCFRLAEPQQRPGRWHGGGGDGYAWGSGQWKDATWRKVPAAAALLELGVNALVSDIDADFLISLDAHHTTKAPGDPGLELGFTLGRLMNTGVWFSRAKPPGTHAGAAMLHLLQQWLSMRHAHNHDQEGFKALAATVLGPFAAVPGDDSRLGRVLGGTVVMGQLPLSSFLHSYSFGVMQLHRAQGTPPYAVHLVFGYGGLASKVYKLRDAHLGWDPPGSEYYAPPGGLLSFDLDLPPVPPGFSGWARDGAARGEEDMEVVHARAVDDQLSQLWHALGLALALNRTLVLPRMRCFCVRGWFANEACRLPGDARSVLPFDCPGDHVYDLDALAAPAPAVGGAALRVRPPGFATDPRLPARLAAARDARVELAPGRPDCAAAGAAPLGRGACVEQQALPGGRRRLVVPPALSGELLGELLAAQPTGDWLHVANVSTVFAGFADPGHAAAFAALLDKLPAEWCCRSAARIAAAGVPDGHLHAIRPTGSPQRACARRVGGGGERVHSFFC
ncbi:arabinosyltransferase [Scenedesmus sp. PABB004]|nr:arabinosyltransferase [Scenedesmus sp. PABB004]